MNTQITQEQHERLCAFLFDELPAAERAAFEAELAASPALMAERDKLEASMALVREFAPAAPTGLSDVNRAALSQAAATGSGPSFGNPGNPGPTLVWYRHPGLQVAAAVAIAVVSFRALDRSLLDDNFGVRTESASLDSLAQVEETEKRAGERGRAPSTQLPEGVRFDAGRPLEKSSADRAGAYLPSEAKLDPAFNKGRQSGPGQPAGAGFFEAPDSSAASPTVVLQAVQPGSDGTPPASKPELSALVAATTATPAVDALGGLAGGPSDWYLGQGADNEADVMLGLEALGYIDGANGPTAGFFFDEGQEGDFKATTMSLFGAELGDEPQQLELIEPGLADLPTTPGSPGMREREAVRGELAGDVTSLARRVTDPSDAPADELRGKLRTYGLLLEAEASTETLAAGEPVVRYAELLERDLLHDLGHLGQELTEEEVVELADLDSDGRFEELFDKLGYLATDEADDQAGDDRFEIVARMRLNEELRQKRKQVQVDEVYTRVIQRCLPRPSERPSMMYFRYWGDNGYEFPVHDALSTFSVDVDTASYTLARRYLQEGVLPERAQIRTEEFVNYFTPDLAAPNPVEGDVFSISTELAPSLFGPQTSAGSSDHWMLRVGVRGKQVSKQERDPLALTFVIDVSGSMKENNRLELVKHSLRLLVGELHPSDSIAIVTFSNTAQRVLEMTSVGNGAAIEQALYGMAANGGTNAEGGLRMGYEEAVLGHTQGAVNRVVFLSDGVGNIGETNENQLVQDVQRAREKGIYLNTIGVGMGNHNDRFLEQLADGGDGLCNYIDGPDEAYRALVENFTGAFQPIARDVKIQVEFDPAQVASYRLLGYENRAIADADFRNDKVDAGEVGAGHQVVALYEIVLANVDSDSTKPLATARLRYKLPYAQLAGGAADPEKDASTELEVPCFWSGASGTFEGATLGFQKNALAAQFAEFLRRSSHTNGDSVSLLRYKLEELAKLTQDDELTELLALVQLAQPQLEPALLVKDELKRLADDLHAFEYDCLRRVYLGAQPDETITTYTEKRRKELRENLRVRLYELNGLEVSSVESEASEGPVVR